MSSTGQDDGARRTRIDQVVSQYVARREVGERVSHEELAQQHPDLMPELAEALTNQRLIARAREDFLRRRLSGDSTAELSSLGARETAKLTVRCPHCSDSVEILADVPWSDITCLTCGNVFSLVADRYTTREAPTLKRIAHFELIERIGVGGFGTVWKARDTVLDRTVALKLPRRGQLTEEEIDQFLREARAAAQLRHPHIVSVHEAGRTDELVFIVSDLVRGVSLGDWLAIRSPSPREAAELCVLIAEALQHAHEAGVVHRDLKPGNIMVDAQNHPHIMDFGLAKRDVGEVTMTIEGQVLGTPAYMAPEQAMGKSHQSSPRTDVYSLGVILYELLTGELPFRGNASMLIHQVLNDEPPRPRQLNNHVPADLETICLRCLEKDPARRFATARELADELRRFLQQQPILSRPVGRLARAVRWSTRHRTVAVLLVAVVLALVVGSSVSTYFALLAAGFRGQAEGFRRKAAEQETEIQDTRRMSRALAAETSTFFAAGSALMRSPYNRQLQMVAPLCRERPHDALLLLEDEDRCSASLRDIAWRLYHARCLREHQLERLPSAPLLAMAFASDGQALALLDRSGTLWVLRPDQGNRWRVTDQHTLPQLDSWPQTLREGELAKADEPPGASVPLACRLLPGDLSVVARTSEGLRRWTPGQSSWQAWPAHVDGSNGDIRRLAVSPNGRLLAALLRQPEDDDARHSPRVQIVDVNSGQTLSSAPTEPSDVVDLAFVGDEVDQLLLRRASGLWQSLRGDAPWRWSASLPQPTWQIAAGGPWTILQGDSLWLVSPDDDRLPPVQLPVVSGSPRLSAISPDGHWLAATSDQQALCFWHLSPSPAAWTVDDADVVCLEFSPDADRLAAAVAVEIRLYDSVLGEPQEPVVVDGAVGQLAWSPNGSRLAYCQQDGRARVVDLAGRRRQTEASAAGTSERYTCLVFESDDQLLLGTDAGRLVQWSLGAGETRQLKQYAAPINHVVCCPAIGVRLAASGNEIHALRPSGDDLMLSGHADAVQRVAISRSGDTLLSRSASGQVLRWRVNWAKKESQHASLPLATSGYRTAELSPDGQTIATLDGSRLLFWDAKSGEYRGSLAGDATLRQARFCTQPLEGTHRIAVTDDQGHLHMWAGDEAPRQTTCYVGGVVRSMCSLDPAGQLMCVGDFPHVALLDPTQSSSHQRVPRDRPAMHVAAANQASPVLALANWNGTIDVYQLRAATGELIRQQTLAPATSLVDLCISADGRRLVALAADGRLLSWRCDADGAYVAADAPSDTVPSAAHCLLLSSDGQQCWVGTSAGKLVGWTFDAAAGVWQSAGERALHQGAVRAVHWLAEGKVASIGDDGKLVVYDLNGDRRVAAVEQPSANCLATHASAGLLAVGSGDDVHVWRLDNGQLRRQGQPLSEHSGPVVALAFTADGQQLVSSSQDRSLKFWPVELFGGPPRSSVPEHIRRLFERGRQSE